MKITRNIGQKIVDSLGWSATSTASSAATVHETVDPLADEAAYAQRCNENLSRFQTLKLDKVHYGCGSRFLENGWLNLDRSSVSTHPEGFYLAINLVSRHPFPSDYFKFAFAEDFIEHLDQAESLIFLSEAFRTLSKNGVLRLSFPELSGVLRHHYRSSDYEGAVIGREEAYTLWEHKHFYCKESLAIVAKHIGFSDVRCVEYGESHYEALCHLDSRPEQKGLNLYVELTK